MQDLFQDLYPLSRGMDASVVRHRVLSANIANLNTPGFIRSDVKFEELLNDKIGSESSPQKLREALNAIRPQIYSDPSGPTTPDGNNISIEKEIGRLNRNEILYNAYAEILSLKLGQLKFVIGSR